MTKAYDFRSYKMKGLLEERRSKVNDKEIVELYWKRIEVAIEETERKYGRFCFSISNGISMPFTNNVLQCLSFGSNIFALIFSASEKRS